MDGKFVGKPPSAAEAKTKTVAGREPILQRLLDVWNSRTLVLKGESHPLPRS
jgi:hypothetical protein